MTVTTAQANAGTRLIGGPVRLCGWSLNDGVATDGLTTRGSVTAPAAGGTIASILLPIGTYTVEWSLELSGTPGAGDVDNVAVFIGATQLATSVNAGAVGTYGQEEIEVAFGIASTTLAAKAIGIGTAGAVYVVNFTIIPTGNSQCTFFDGAQPLAFSSIPQGGADNQYISEDGVMCLTQLSVQTTQGTVSGVVYYYLVDETGHPEPRKPYSGG